MRRISSEHLVKLMTTICRRAGSDEEEARLGAENLVVANLMGHDSHGVGLLPRYIESALDGRLTMGGHAEVVADRGPFVLVDGNMGYGQVVGAEAMALGLAKAAEFGVAVVGLRNVHHLGRIGAWAEICGEAGFISIHYVNAVGLAPLVAPFGGSDCRYTTNPYCTAFPATEGPPIVLDMATSKIAFGKIVVAFNKGEALADETLIDGEGRPTNDPAVMVSEGKRAPTGALLSFGLHKGYGLALVCELLAGGLTGGGVSGPQSAERDTIQNNMLTIILDPDGFGAGIPLARDIDDFTAWVKASPPAPGTDEVMVPGDPERKRRAERQRDGIPIDDNTWRGLVEAGLSVGMNRVDFEGLSEA